MREKAMESTIAVSECLKVQLPGMRFGAGTERKASPKMPEMSRALPAFMTFVAAPA